MGAHGRTKWLHQVKLCSKWKNYFRELMCSFSKKRTMRGLRHSIGRSWTESQKTQTQSIPLLPVSDTVQLPQVRNRLFSTRSAHSIRGHLGQIQKMLKPISILLWSIFRCIHQGVLISTKPCTTFKMPSRKTPNSKGRDCLKLSLQRLITTWG